MKRTVRIFHESGEVEDIEAENLYHAQNILSFAFFIGDEEGKNDVCYGLVVDTNLRAYVHEKSLILDNFTKDFWHSYLDEIDYP